jgi:hypothetical protein
MSFHDLPITETVTEFPVHLDIELTNRCNMKCEMCPFHGPDAIAYQHPADMNFQMYKRIIDEGVNNRLQSVKLNFGGEPLLYDKVLDAIVYAKRQGVSEVQINTNGLLIDNKMAISLIMSKLDLLIVTDYDIAEQYVNVVKLLIIRKAWRESYPKVRVKTNNPDRWKDIPDEIVPNVYFDYCNLEEDFSKSDYKCTQPWQRLLILADGTICSCSCGLLITDKIIQNIANVNVKYAWNNKKMTWLRHCHSNGESHLIRECRMCPARKDLNLNKTNNNQNERLFTEPISKRL